jgi:hypothetical protein
MSSKIWHRDHDDEGDDCSPSMTRNPCGKMKNISDILTEYRSTVCAQEQASADRTKDTKADCILSPKKIRTFGETRRELPTNHAAAINTQQEAGMAGSREHSERGPRDSASLMYNASPPHPQVLSERLLNLRNARRKIESELVRLGLHTATTNPEEISAASALAQLICGPKDVNTSFRATASVLQTPAEETWATADAGAVRARACTCFMFLSTCCRLFKGIIGMPHTHTHTLTHSFTHTLQSLMHPKVEPIVVVWSSVCACVCVCTRHIMTDTLQLDSTNCDQISRPPGV